MHKIFLIAGEHSGDVLGGRLMSALKSQNSDVVFSGVGGPEMISEGLESFLPMQDLCVMGVFEVIKHYPRLRRLGFKIIEEIERTQPDVLVSIDLPDFNFKVSELLKKRGVFKGKIIHYVAPSVWGWRPGRAKKIAKFLDGLMCLFPFEPEYFTVHGLRTEFVGHSLVESKIQESDPSYFETKKELPEDVRFIGLFLGSRQREIDAHLEVFVHALLELDNIHVIVPTFDQFYDQIDHELQESGLSYTITCSTEDKWAAMKACDAALAVSGTVGLELAYLRVPHVIGYRMSRLSWLIVKLFVRAKFAHLANILLERQVVPELLQEHCEAEKLTEVLQNILDNPKLQKEGLDEVSKMLNVGGVMPSMRAANFILKALS